MFVYWKIGEKIQRIYEGEGKKRKDLCEFHQKGHY